MKCCFINYALHARAWRKRLRKYEEACAGLYMMVNDRDEELKSKREEIRLLKLVIEDLRHEMRKMRARIRNLEARAKEEREEAGGGSAIRQETPAEPEKGGAE